MNGCVIGPGLLGSFLGAIAGLSHAVPGPSGRLRYSGARFAGRDYPWSPQLLEQPTGLALVACRAPDTPQVMPQHSLLAQNGLGHRGPCIACFVGCDADRAGRVLASDDRCRLVLADPGPAWHGVIQRWRQAGIIVDTVSPHAASAALWEKAILNASLGPLCLLSGKSMAAVWQDPELQRWAMAITAEGAAIAAATGINLPPGIEARSRSFFAALGDHQPSITRDHRELTWIFPPLLRHARASATPCPALRELAQALHVDDEATSP